MEDGPGRRRAHAFKSERQAAFSKKVRSAFLDDGRKRKDAERARMEAYRRLCAAEGIQSKRLEEYDRARETAQEQLGKALEQVDYNQSLTNNEKKKRKFNLKRKYAGTTVTDLLKKRERKYSAVTGIEEIQRKKEEERQTARQEREERERQKATRVAARKSRNAHFAKRTKSGQPVMSSRMEALLQKVAK